MAVSGKIIIIVPSQGNTKKIFKSVAHALKTKIYKDAMILETYVTGTQDSSMVSFKTINGGEFNWNTAAGVSRVIVVSHGSYDGPNLAYHASAIQPWMFSRGDESPGKTFWSAVGKSLSGDAKIVLLGCKEGDTPVDGMSYAQHVAQTVHRPVYGSSDFFGAAKEEAVLKHLRAIEEGKVHRPMMQFR
jgi:hypothetical protein